MSKLTPVLAVLAASAVAIVVSHKGCTSTAGSEPLECMVVEDCPDRAPSDCDPELGGGWLCEAGLCLALCFECDDVEDCQHLIWQGDPANCPVDRQYFECPGRFCEHLCQTQCAIPSDCEGQPWPANAACSEADGHWLCNQGTCVTVCDACTEAADCMAANPVFPKCCDGHWECNDARCDAVCDLGCETREDCVGQPWPEYLECTEAQGRWDCIGCECEANCVSNCEAASECLSIEWDVDCEGHWSCDAGWCTPHCGETCGDGSCSETDGEGLDTCPADCGPPCADAADCLDRAWGLPCQGRFECDAGDCIRRCDYSTCGTGGCDPVGGESERSCPDDCLVGCITAADCFDEPWMLLNCPTGGSHTCISEVCGQVCGLGTCGDGICSPQASPISGESGNSCAADCGDGPCTAPSDCNAYFWSGGCGGHWVCAPGGRCDPSCDAVTCSDGNCDVLGGESPFTCPADCTAYQCLLDADCEPLAIPPGCQGSYLCVDRVCTPQCA